VQPAGAVPDYVHRVVFLAVGIAAVHLDAEGVDIEGVESLLVVERIQVDADEIVGPEVVPLGEGRLDLVRLAIVTQEGEIEVLAVVGILSPGLLGQIAAEVGMKVLKSVTRRLRPDRVVEPAIDDRRPVGFEGLGMAGREAGGTAVTRRQCWKEVARCLCLLIIASRHSLYQPEASKPSLRIDTISISVNS
jgi:hypothetical protein